MTMHDESVVEIASTTDGKQFCDDRPMHRTRGTADAAMVVARLEQSVQTHLPPPAATREHRAPFAVSHVHAAPGSRVRWRVPLDRVIDPLMAVATYLIIVRLRRAAVGADDLLLLSETFLLMVPARAPFDSFGPAVKRELRVQWFKLLAGVWFFALFAIARSVVLDQPAGLDTLQLGMWLALVPPAQFGAHAAFARYRRWLWPSRPLTRAALLAAAFLLICTGAMAEPTHDGRVLAARSIAVLDRLDPEPQATLQGRAAFGRRNS
jgi:hypothetical protein